MSCSRARTKFEVFHLRIVFHTRWIVPGAQRISTAGSFSIKHELLQAARHAPHIALDSMRIVFHPKHELFQAHNIFSLEDRFSTRWIFPGVLNILRLTEWGSFFNREELFQAHHIFPLEDRFSEISTVTRWIVPGKHNVFPFEDRFPKRLIFPGMHHVFSLDRFSTRWIVPGVLNILRLTQWGSFFNTMECSRQAPRISTAGSFF